MDAGVRRYARRVAAFTGNRLEKSRHQHQQCQANLVNIHQRTHTIATTVPQNAHKSIDFLVLWFIMKPHLSENER